MEREGVSEKSIPVFLWCYRDRATFVLTRDMAYVINDGDRPTVQFQKFCDLCCTAYNELRKHTTLFVSLLSLVSWVGVAGEWLGIKRLYTTNNKKALW